MVLIQTRNADPKNYLKECLPLWYRDICTNFADMIIQQIVNKLKKIKEWDVSLANGFYFRTTIQIQEFIMEFYQ